MNNWPTEIHSAILERVGPSPEISRLGGMSDSAVQRVSGKGRTAVLKCGRNPVETHVYSVLVDRLRAAGVNLPVLYAACQSGGLYWLLIEDIPEPLPRDRWHADHEQLAILRRLHEIPVGEITLHPATYRPAWTESLTTSALTLFHPRQQTTIRARLETLRKKASTLFEPRCLVSGDPNPLNWGLRADGSLVLFDLERITLATPAIDLTITLPGLGDAGAFGAIAGAYNPDLAGADLNRLSREIGIAKAWSVVEFLGDHASGKTEPSFDLAPLIEQFPAWLAGVTTWEC